MTKIRGQLKSIWPDRTQYKPYAYNLEMDKVWVEIDIPDEECRGERVRHIDKEAAAVGAGGVYYEGETTLTLNGFTCLLGNIADAIDTLHLASLKKKNTRLD